MQNDMQAQARSHRIGQKNQVLVIRFLTSGTVSAFLIIEFKLV